MQPVRSRKDLHKKPPSLKVKLKQCLLLFSQLKNAHNLDHYTFFFYQNVFICQIPQEKIPMKQTTQNGKYFLPIFIHLFVCTRKLTDTFQLVNKNCVCSYFMRWASFMKPNKGKSLYYLKLKLLCIKFWLKNNVKSKCHMFLLFQLYSMVLGIFNTLLLVPQIHCLLIWNKSPWWTIHKQY